jgi:hypothetical protein
VTVVDLAAVDGQENFNGSGGGEEMAFEQQSIRVLRLVPTIPVPRDVEDVQNEVMGTVDFIDTRVNLLLFDCKLFLLRDLGEAYIQIPDLRVLLRYYLEPGFVGEIDFHDLLSQMDTAVCKHLGLLAAANETDGAALYNFIDSPRWEAWIGASRPIPSELEAVKAFMGGASS